MKNTLLYAIALINLVLFTSCANDDKVNQAIALVKSLKDKLPIADLNYQLDQLRLIKRDIYNIDTDQEIDFFVLYLWHYEEQMYHSTEIAMDPKLSLLEWREFVDEVHW